MDTRYIDITQMSEREFLTMVLWLLGQEEQEVEEHRSVHVTHTLTLDLVLDRG